MAPGLQDTDYCFTDGKINEFPCNIEGLAVGGIPFLAGLLSLGMAYILSRKVEAHPRGNELMNKISDQVAEGAKAFLKTEYYYLTYFVFAVSMFLLIVFSAEPYTSNLVVGVDVDDDEENLDGLRSFACFLVGAVLSATAGWIGMSIATAANVRTASAADTTGSSGSADIPHGLNAALKIAFAGGAVMGFTVVGLALFGLGLFYFLMVQGRDFNDDVPFTDERLSIESLSSFGFGASAIALFARVAGGIYTKAADVGADLVGKVEQGIPEDDPRNPATIADNVGDNVGDVAGMGADLFESFVGSIIASASLASDPVLLALPFFLASAGVVASLIGFFFVSTKEDASQTELLHALHRGTNVATFLALLFNLGIICLLMGGRIEDGMRVWGCTILGLIAGVIIGIMTEYFTSYSFLPTQSISNAGVTGPATVLIQGLGVGMLSCMPPIVLICIVIFGCNELAGSYGIAISAVGMLTTLGVTLATDAYGPIADNAGGIAEMAELPESVRDTTDALDALGNTTAATGKGFAIGSAVLTSISLMNAFSVKTSISGSLDDPIVLAGALLGAMLPFLFAALTMLSVQKAAGAIIMVVRKQFREKPGIMDGSEQPDHNECVAISTQSSIEEMILPGAVAVFVPFIIGFMVGPKCLLGVLGGTIVSGACMAIMMSNAGGAWDNAKKYIEIEKAHGGKGTDIHDAVVIGDTVGDPFKDTSGPALNILLKLISIIALTLSSLIDGNDDWEDGYIGIIPLAILAAICYAVYVYIYKDNKYDYNKVDAPKSPAPVAGDTDAENANDQL
eukprot:CAMPEP_0118850826 /NCGR_PEP_ID=MMETSP1163-20130328/509_1 /TAXON_ID=124430 /ORGANISM="Phaeomonas parva, Strain CCMP2877" /LENGTH=794 /DNA_ID=CAMNT_0006783065 /DNA_START=25 /DNA_END=2409 /DNA_ORIENTATION=-